MSENKNEELYLLVKDGIESFEGDFEKYKMDPRIDEEHLEYTLLLFEQAKKIFTNQNNLKERPAATSLLIEACRFATICILKIEILNYFGINRLIRDSQQNQDNKLISNYWLTEIFPSFQTASLISVITIDNQTYGFFGIGVSPFKLVIAYHVMEVDEFWSDRVEEVLNRFEVNEIDGLGGGLDGVRYNMKIFSQAEYSHVSFSSSTNESIRTTVKAMQDVGYDIVKSATDERLKEYLQSRFW